MLKIKDDVDLEELKKFGFRKSDKVFKYVYDYTILTIIDYQIRIYEDRHIEVSQNAMYDWDYRLQDKLFDLIEARISRKSLAVIYSS